MNQRQTRPRPRRRRRRRNPMSYLVGAGLTLVVLLGCLPLLNHSGETPPDPSAAPTTPSATQETEVIATSTKPTQPGPDCPAILRELLERNPETYDFVAGYPGTYDLQVDLSSHPGGNSPSVPVGHPVGLLPLWWQPSGGPPGPVRLRSHGPVHGRHRDDWRYLLESRSGGPVCR